MSAARLGLLLRRELGQALRSRWFLAYAAVFLLAGIAFAGLGVGQGLAGGGRISLRALVGLMHLVLIMLPPMALIPAIAVHADDREGGLLEFLLAQPVRPREIYLAKWGAATAGIGLAVLLGLIPGLAGALLRGASAAVLLALLGLTLLLGVGFASAGLALAAVTGNRGRATASAVILWLVLLVLGSLGLMATFVRVGVPEGVLVGWSLANPLEVFRLAVLSLIDPDLSLFGPTATALRDRLGAGGLVASAFAVLGAWTAVAGAAGLVGMARRE